MNSDKMSREETACACNRVKYDPIVVDHTKRIFRERWSCEDCGCEFVKKAALLPDAKKIEEVVGLVKDSMGQARMHRNDIWLYSIERILTLLTEEE